MTVLCTYIHITVCVCVSVCLHCMQNNCPYLVVKTAIQSNELNHNKCIVVHFNCIYQFYTMIQPMAHLGWRWNGGHAVERRTVNRGDGGLIPPAAISKRRQFRSSTLPMSFGRDTKSW